MNNQIPKIIHQIWSDIYEPLPKMFQELGETWKYYHKGWKYIFWNDQMMDQFINNYFPVYADLFHDVQRWDAIRYLILYEMGGLYVDFDYECIESVEDVLRGNCCFALEPKEHKLPFLDSVSPYFNNAFIAATPRHPFIKTVVDAVFQKELPFLLESLTRFEYILCTTGPGMLSNVYKDYANKKDVYLIPADYVSPFSSFEIRSIWRGIINEDWEKRLQKAVAVHYFMGTWNK